MSVETTGFHELRKEIEAEQEDGFCLSVSIQEWVAPCHLWEIPLAKESWYWKMLPQKWIY